GLLRRVFNKETGELNLVRIKFMTYGTRKKATAAKSGAYLFFPDSDEAQPFIFTKPKIRVTKGKIMSKVVSIINEETNFVHQVLLVEGEESFSIENKFHLRQGTFDNHELVMRFYTDIYNGNDFYTDLNGLQMAHRKFYDKIPLQGNVYPMPTMMYFQNDKTRLNIITAQPLGTTMRHVGVVDVFLDRRLVQDDGRGLGQGVTDNKYTKESFKIILERKPFENKKASLKTQIVSLKQLNPVHLMHILTENILHEISFMRSTLPCDVHLLNLRNYAVKHATELPDKNRAFNESK
ncbi:alpha-mannosidase 2-like protein, partial [Leptotrombidium deliense]